MKSFSNCIKKLGLTLCIAITSITSLPLFTNQAVQQTTQDDALMELAAEIQKESLERLLLKVLDQLTLVDATIEDLATVISNDIVKRIKNKSDHIFKLRSAREVTRIIKNNSYTVVNGMIIHSLIHVTRSIANYLLDALNNGFYELNAFDVQQCIQIPQVSSLTIEDLENELRENELILSKLTSKASNVGLCWYNKVYRTTKRTISRPWRKYHLGPTIAMGSVISATALFTWWRLGGKLLPAFPKCLQDFRLPGTSQKLFGNVPVIKDVILIGHQTDKENAYFENPFFKTNSDNLAKIENIGLAGNLEQKVLELFLSNQSPITNRLLITTGAIMSYYYSTNIKNWFSTKGKELDNFLMGGVYRQRQVGDIQYISKTTFDDVIGCDEIKEYGKQLCLYLKDPERFDRAKLTLPKGHLLVGETRTGKSYFVTALLGELQRLLGTGSDSFKIYQVTYANVEQLGIDNILAYAKSMAPCILFIDEIDLLGLDRSLGSPERKRLSEFLTAMSGYLSDIDPEKAVIMMGATNKQESIDVALKTPGRFGNIALFDRPNYNERKEYVERELAKLALNLEDFDIERLAQETDSYVFEAIGHGIRQAKIKAKINNQPITQELLDKGFDATTRGIMIEETKIIPDDQKELLAVHQAGHTLANILLDSRMKLFKVTIQRVKTDIKTQSIWLQAWQKNDEKQKPTEYGRLYTHHDKDALDIENKSELLKQCKIMLAGHIAEQLLLSSCSYSYHAHDRQQALKLAQSIVFGGISLDQLPKKIKDQYLNDSFNLMKQCEQEVELLLYENKDKLVTLAKELKEKGTLSILDINILLNGQQEQTKTIKESDKAVLDLFEQKAA